MKKNIVIIFVLSMLMLTTIQIVNNNTVSANITGYSEYNGQNGFLYSYPVATWNGVHNAVSSSSILQTYIYGRSLYNGNYGNYRGFCFFDTSSIPDTAIITKVNLSFTIDSVSNNPGLIILSDNATAHRPGTSLALDDYDISFYETKNYQSTTLTSGSKNITLSNTTWLINLTGVTRFCFTNNKCDGLDVAPTVNSVQIYLESEDLIKLWITYTTPSPPSKPVYFHALSDNSTVIRLNITKGVDQDRTQIFRSVTSYPYRTGTLVYNGTSNYYNDTGLIANTTYFYTAYAWKDSSATYNSTSINEHDTTKGIGIFDVHLNNTNSTSSYTFKYKSYPTNFIIERIEDCYYNSLPTLSKDGNWNTYGNPVSDTAYFMVYTKPTTTNINWVLKDGGGNTSYPITTAMYNQNTSYLILYANNDSEDEMTALYCLKGVSNYAGLIFIGYSDYGETEIYEECLITNTTISKSEGFYINVSSIGNLTPIHHYTNIVNAYGSETFKQNNTGYWLWNNWTGLRLYLYKNFVNVSGDLTNKTNATGYIVYGNATGNATIFDENEYIIPIFTTISLMGVGFLMVRRRKKNES